VVNGAPTFYTAHLATFNHFYSGSPKRVIADIIQIFAAGWKNLGFVEKVFF